MRGLIQRNERMEKDRPDYLCSLLEWFRACMSQCVSVFVTSLSTDKPASSLALGAGSLEWVNP